MLADITREVCYRIAAACFTMFSEGGQCSWGHLGTSVALS